MEFFGLNILAVLLAAVAGMVTGAVWYGVFSNPWMKAAGLTPEQIVQKGSDYAVAMIAQVIIAILLGGLIGHLSAFSLSSGAISGFFCWLGFCVAPMAVNHRFQSKPWSLTIIDGGHWLVVFILQGAILGWMGA